ncbi:MAG: hypothetical protein KDC67_14150, partial [Ignavibacteriae bacterium]|nr:hypothetical protein [Ignavibacteriota bacterium]
MKKKEAVAVPVPQEEILYSGFAIAIDENIFENESGDLILDIVKQIENKGIPLVKYNELPTNENFIKNINSVSFVVLDWELNPLSKGAHDESQEGLQLGDSVKDSSFDDNIRFIEQIKENCFAPIFILTAVDTSTVIEKLLESDKDLYNTEDESKNFILIRQKSSVTGQNDLFESVTEWIKSNPSIYTLKKWDFNFYKSKNKTFLDLFRSSKSWPSIMWRAFKDDSVDESSSIDDLIYRNIKGRSEVLKLDNNLIEIAEEDFTIEQSEIRKIIIDSQYVGNDSIPKND